MTAPTLYTSYFSMALRPQLKPDPDDSTKTIAQEVKLTLTPINPDESRPNPLRQMGLALAHGTVESVAIAEGDEIQRLTNSRTAGDPPQRLSQEGPIPRYQHGELEKRFPSIESCHAAERRVRLSKPELREFIIQIAHPDPPDDHGFIVLLEQSIDGEIIDRDFLVFH